KARGRTSAACASSPSGTDCVISRWGRATTTGSARRSEGLVSAPAQSCGSATTGAAMALSDVWARTLVYFGIAEEEDWDEDGYLTEGERPQGHEHAKGGALTRRRL